MTKPITKAAVNHTDSTDSILIHRSTNLNVTRINRDECGGEWTEHKKEKKKREKEADDTISR